MDISIWYIFVSNSSETKDTSKKLLVSLLKFLQRLLEQSSQKDFLNKLDIEIYNSFLTVTHKQEVSLELNQEYPMFFRSLFTQ
jgi:hypothetical protein